jgi:hypothetical protein
MRKRIAALASHVCQWENIPLAIKKVLVQWRSAAIRQNAMVNATRAQGAAKLARSSEAGLAPTRRVREDFCFH